MTNSFHWLWPGPVPKCAGSFMPLSGPFEFCTVVRRQQFCTDNYLFDRSVLLYGTLARRSMS
jgi:hypothetical protein